MAEGEGGEEASEGDGRAEDCHGEGRAGEGQKGGGGEGGTVFLLSLKSLPLLLFFQLVRSDYLDYTFFCSSSL